MFIGSKKLKNMTQNKKILKLMIFLGKFYANYILYLKLTKYLKSQFFDYLVKELGNFSNKKNFSISTCILSFFYLKTKKKISINYFNRLNIFT